MKAFDRKKHWENIYTNKRLDEVSWYQPKPTTSIEFITQSGLPKNAKIIDVGGGDSLLTDHLLELGYTDITVLDISEAALERAKKRLGKKAGLVTWIVADAAHFEPSGKYDIWHDRAAFHFLTEENEINHYIQTIKKHLNKNGLLVVGTFSEQGPDKCSGIEIKKYSETSLSKRLQKFFEKIRCITVDHITPFNTIQNFLFCSFKQADTSVS